MPIGNITQSVSTIPAPPHRGVDVQTVFVNKQEDFQDHLADTTIDELNALKDQLNTRIGEINSTTTTMNGYADTASAGASTATTKAGEAATSASEALASRNQASTFATNSSNSATKSSQWADNSYNVEVEAGKYSAKHWATIAQSVDVSTKVDKDMSGYTLKVAPVGTDLLALSDSEASFGIKKLSIGDLTDTILSDSTLTGIPTAPTPTSGDNSGKIATTEFVKNNVGVNLSGITAYHLLEGNLSATINANYVEVSATTTRNYTTSDYIFDSLNNKLYDCILASTAGALLTNTTYFTLITAGTLHLNTALIPFANGIDSNGSKNTIVYKNETITGLTLTAGKNYVYAKNDGTYGVNKFKEQYNSYTGFGDYFDTNKNKWFNNISTFSDDCSTIANFIADEATGGTASSISSVNGELKVLNSGATYGGARFQFNATIGEKYRVKFKLTSNSTTCTFGIGTSARSLNLGYISLNSAGDYYLDIVASGTPLYGIAYNNNVSGAISTWDDIAIYPINYDGSVDISNAIEITESRNYLDAIVHADQNGQVTYVEELPKIEYKDIIKANKYQGKNACTAWMVANGSVTPPIIYDEDDISSLIRTATGAYRMYFKERMDNINYSIGHMVTVETNPYQSTIYPIAKTLDYFEFATSSSSAFVNASVLDIQIFGGKN